MVHVICDFCGKSCGKNSYMISITPIFNSMNKHKGIMEFKKDDSSNFVCCCDCYGKQLKMPNPYEEYSKTCDESQLNMNKYLNNYTDLDLIND